MSTRTRRKRAREKDTVDTNGRPTSRQKQENSSSKSTVTGAARDADSKKGEEKIFNDSIHGHIELHPLMVKFIDTPQFQRLRYIKQLGGCYYVFPGASHNRFEHSIGVGYLAGEMVETLKRKQPELLIDDKDVLCVKLAGLCHDLGHGPFSHLFDKKFIRKMLPRTPWKHEDASVMMFKHLIKVNDLKEEMKIHGLKNKDITFIEEMIKGVDVASNEKWSYKGRDAQKSFLYEIVANKRTEVDVDKWDYFARDCHHLGISHSFDLWRFMKFARVIKVDGKFQICTRDKEVNNLYEMFHTRNTLHREAYQHKTTNIIEHMITEALVAANAHLKIPGKEKKICTMSEAIHDPVAYTRLTDQILERILSSDSNDLQEARDILERVERRRLYKYVGWVSAKDPVPSEEAIPKEIFQCLRGNDGHGLEEKDIVVEIVTFNYGKKKNNPINDMKFYAKSNPDETIEIHQEWVSHMLPQTFQEKQIRVYCKKMDDHITAIAKRCFELWCKKDCGGTPEPNMSSRTLTSTSKSPYIDVRKETVENLSSSKSNAPRNLGPVFRGAGIGSNGSMEAGPSGATEETAEGTAERMGEGTGVFAS